MNITPAHTLNLDLPGEEPVEVLNDGYSDRVRCDHPQVDDGEELGHALIETAVNLNRGRVMVMASTELQRGLQHAGLATEGVIPGFYRGQADCAVMGWWQDADRRSLADADGVQQVMDLMAERANAPTAERLSVETARATVEDAESIAELLGETFSQYPTPSDDPAYVAQAIEAGHPFRCVRDEGALVACASADLVFDAHTAELTDCATRPTHRGQGLMRALLDDLMDDLRDLDYPTAFTLARARIPGVNLVFQRLGFELRGTMTRSCRIGNGLEDMNILSRTL
ncbi:MAG: GNAT family N-acetyltransferase [Bradymonadia bacterium]